jgi:hypothetical protein
VSELHHWKGRINGNKYIKVIDTPGYCDSNNMKTGCDQKNLDVLKDTLE